MGTLSGIMGKSAGLTLGCTDEKLVATITDTGLSSLIIPASKLTAAEQLSHEERRRSISKFTGRVDCVGRQMFLALLAGTGLRAGEASGVEIDKHISSDFTTLLIRQKVRRGRLENFLKTDAGRRDVDLCPALATLLKEFVGTRTSGFLFQNQRGNFLSQTNLLRRTLHPALKKQGQPKAGFHAFRRFRTTWLRKTRTPEDLIRFWLGHADETVTDGYSRLREDVAYRKEVAKEVGLGFEISEQTPVVVPNVPNFAVSVFQGNVR